MDLLFDGYIMPLIRSNKDCSKNYKCRQHSTNNFNERVPCSASITILNDLIIRGVLEHNHPPLSLVAIESKKAKSKEKELAATTRIPLQQIHSQIHSQLVKELTNESSDAQKKEVLDEVAKVFPDFLNVKSCLSKIRSQNLPKLPQTINEINLEGNTFGLLIFNLKKKIIS